MFNLPTSTEISKPLYKKTVFEKFNIKAAERERFDADVSRMALVNYVSPNRVPALKEGTEIKDFYVLQVVLKQREFDSRNIQMLQKFIPQHILFALQYNDQTKLCVFHTRFLQSEWRNSSDVFIPLKGITLDEVWNNIVAEIGSLDATSEQTIEELIIKNEQREKLLKQIEQLEKQCRSEKQTRKKYVLHQKIQDLKLKVKQI